MRFKLPGFEKRNGVCSTEAFRELAEAEGIGYQTLINRTLRQALTDEHITEESLRRVIREEMARSG